MIRVLFVDNDSNVVNGLKRIFREMREEADPVFVGSGSDALALLDSQEFDVVVSDMKMTGSSGSQFLEKVAAEHPQIVRIIFSGQTDREACVASAGPAHHFLSKPCDPELLFNAIRRARSLRNTISDPSVMKAVSRVRCLPSLPALYGRLLEILRVEGPSVAAVAEIVGRDLGMTTKVMQLVNSAFFGMPRRTDSLSNAISFLGIDTMKSLVLAAELFHAHQPSTGRFDLQGLLNHSLQTGRVAKDIAVSEGLGKRGESNAMMAGILHDVGKLVLANEHKSSYDIALHLADKASSSACAIEKERFGASHAQIGAYLLALWGFEDEVVEAVAYHHDPLACCESSFSLLTVVHAANSLAHEGETIERTDQALNAAYVEETGKTSAVQVWRNIQVAA